MIRKKIAIIGAGPAGLACAELLTKQKDVPVEVTVFEQMPSAARKFLMAGKTGLNISHNESFEQFVSRYDDPCWLKPMLEQCKADDIQHWMHGLGIDSYIGSSGRIFPNEMKAAPLLRAWLKRLQTQGVHFLYKHQCTHLKNKALSYTDLKLQQQHTVVFDAIVLACGAVSWPQLGSDGQWQHWLEPQHINTFLPSNVGMTVTWSEFMTASFGQPLKRIQAWSQGQEKQFGEMVISHYGLEGGLVYRCNRQLREQFQNNANDANTSPLLFLDLLPDLTIEQIVQKLQQGQKQSLNTRWQKLGLDKTKIALLREVVNKSDWSDHEKMASFIKKLPIHIQGFRPITEAISCAGGVKKTALTQNLQFKQYSGLFACGEMLDWDAPTGGYLLTACLATGQHVAKGVVMYLQNT